jgi:hypothetical protein
MPFGSRNGPSAFQRVTQSVLAPYLWLFTLVYIDDIVVFSLTFKDHIHHWDSVFEAIEKSGLTLSPAKCFLGYQSLLLLGQKVSRLGPSTHKEKIDAIVALKEPNTVNELQTFLNIAKTMETQKHQENTEDLAGVKVEVPIFTNQTEKDAKAEKQTITYVSSETFNLLITIDPAEIKRVQNSYQNDPYFRKVFEKLTEEEEEEEIARQPVLLSSIHQTRIGKGTKNCVYWKGISQEYSGRES